MDCLKLGLEPRPLENPTAGSRREAKYYLVDPTGVGLLKKIVFPRPIQRPRVNKVHGAAVTSPATRVGAGEGTIVALLSVVRLSLYFNKGMVQVSPMLKAGRLPGT